MAVHMVYTNVGMQACASFVQSAGGPQRLSRLSKWYSAKATQNQFAPKLTLEIANPNGNPRAYGRS